MRDDGATHMLVDGVRDFRKVKRRVFLLAVLLVSEKFFLHWKYSNACEGIKTATQPLYINPFSMYKSTDVEEEGHARYQHFSNAHVRNK